jgi:hypothetical protein
MVAPLDAWLLSLGLYAAVGVHLTLLGVLLHSRFLCRPCVASAGSAIAAAIFSTASAGATSPGWLVTTIAAGLLLFGPRYRTSSQIPAGRIWKAAGSVCRLSTKYHTFQIARVEHDTKGIVVELA